MGNRKETGLAPRQPVALDPFAMLRQMTVDFDRLFDESSWPAFRRPFLRRLAAAVPAPWMPGIDVFERNNYLITRIDLPGMKKEDVSIEVTDGQLAISGERKHESDEKTDAFYRSEREYGSFYRSVPLPVGVKFEDVKATFADGVLEVSVPMPAAPQATIRKVEITAPETQVKSAA